MKNLITVIFTLLYSLNLSAQEGVRALAHELDSIYLTASYNNELSEAFVVNFPDSYSQLVEIYGYVESDTLMLSPLYERSHLHIPYFFEVCEKIYPFDTFFQKIISIVQEGSWQSDGIAVFQNSLIHFVNNNIQNFAIELSKLNDDEVLNFWFFYFDGPHPDNRIAEFEELIEKMKLYSKNNANLIHKSFEQVNKSNCSNE